MGSMQAFIQKRKSDGVKKRTVNYALQTVRHVLNLASSEWFDEYGQTWLASALKIKLFREDDKRKSLSLITRGRIPVAFTPAALLIQDGPVQNEHRLP